MQVMGPALRQKNLTKIGEQSDCRKVAVSLIFACIIVYRY